MNLDANPQRASELCQEAHTRLLRSADKLTDSDVRAASLLPGWTVGHVLTHVARNADSHARRITGALDGLDLPKYLGGSKQREEEIKAGAGRSADELVADLEASESRLEQVFDRYAAAGWPNGHFLGGSDYGVWACPAHRLREIEMHHVDLGLGYTPADWPEEYVAWDLQNLLAGAADRLISSGDRRAFMAWLSGRGPLDPETELAPW
ncbi:MULTISPECIES: maleylpyruvate isomerase N-terminal domain-containing protein [unclassified Arthrobacter]|uniref:maleylpyruvate isomerase N-terminal domain-containing protein n=1 Tax=unclassified Arthrobacter TaxID=235627 RepID=UPI000CE2C11A|nr:MULTISPECIES: maleylpyruvate isomerase N-terminal domain-containing protein [unclassified Arthrobacter]